MENMSQDVSKLAFALSRVQGTVGLIPKTKTASILMKSGGKYNYSYADLGDIWEAIRKPLYDNELAITQLFVEGEHKTCLQTTVLHSSGQWIKSSLELHSHEKIQELGSEMTYLRRYGLSSILGIATDEDEDGQLANQSARTPAPIKTAPKEVSEKPSPNLNWKPASKQKQELEAPQITSADKTIGKLKFLILQQDMEIERLEEYILYRVKVSGTSFEKILDTIFSSDMMLNKFFETYSAWLLKFAQ
jgi:hypothetical protein